MTSAKKVPMDPRQGFSFLVIVTACGTSGGASDGGADATTSDSSADVTTSDSSADAAADVAVTDAPSSDASDGGTSKVAFMYTVDFQGTVYGYSWAESSGLLTPIDMDPNTAGIQGAKTGVNLLGVVAHPNNKWLYALTSPGTVEAFSVNPTSGVLTKINALQGVDSGVMTFSLTPQYVTDMIGADPKGRCLYLGDENGNLIVLTIDTQGALALGRVAKSGSSKWLAVDPLARYVVTAASGAITIHKLDATTGLPLAADGGVGAGVTYTTTANPTWVTLDPTGSFTYLPNFTGVHAFRVDALTPALSVLPTLSTATQPMSAVADPNGPFIYTSGGGVEVLAINDAGTLTELNPDAGPYSTGYAISLDPLAKHAYVNMSPVGTIELLDVPSSGTLIDVGRADGDGGIPATVSRTYAWITL